MSKAGGAYRPAPGQPAGNQRPMGSTGPKVIVPLPSPRSLRETSVSVRRLSDLISWEKSPLMMIIRSPVMPYKVFLLVSASTKKRPKTMYSPTRTNGMPQSMKKTGAPFRTAIDSQKTAKPHHKILNGIAKASDPRNRMPARGWPLQRSFSPEDNWRSTADEGLSHIVHAISGL